MNWNFGRELRFLVVSCGVLAVNWEFWSRIASFGCELRSFDRELKFRPRIAISGAALRSFGRELNSFGRELRALALNWVWAVS